MMRILKFFGTVTFIVLFALFLEWLGVPLPVAVVGILFATMAVTGFYVEQTKNQTLTKGESQENGS